MDATAITPGTRVRYVPDAPRRLANGEQPGALRATAAGVVVPLEAAALAALQDIEAWLKGTAWDRPRDPRLVAVKRDDGGYQFATPENLIPDA